MAWRAHQQMLYALTLFAFALAGVVTSGLAYAVRAWRYAMAITVICAGFLVVETARLLRQLAAYVFGEFAAGWALALAALPFAAILLHLWRRRRNTPRHVPGPDDDPVLRRYRQEKLRRRRLRSQQEEMLEQGDGDVAG